MLIHSHDKLYSGGPTEISLKRYNMMSGAEELEVEVVTAAHEERDEEETQGQGWLEGDMFPLNSEHLNSTRLKQIGEALGVSPSATRSQLKLMIEGKLTEIGHNPCNVQVIISGDCGSGKTMICLMNDEGIIKRVDSMAMYVIKESCEQSSTL